MKNLKRPGVISTAVLASVGLLILAGAPGAQRPEPEMHGVFDGDTIFWNWWEPMPGDTFNQQTLQFEKSFNFSVNGMGHDHPFEPNGGVKSWLYHFWDLDGVFNRFARAGNWVAGQQVNMISDSLKYTFEYAIFDPRGDEVFANPKPWVNKTYDLEIQGRDTEIGEDFSQYMFILGAKVLINSYPHAKYGRWTKRESMRFHLKFFRP